METIPSTWSTTFSSHAFHGSWERLVLLAEGSEIAENISGIQLADIIRLRKAIGFLSGLITSIDPELVPRNIWNNCHSYTESAINLLANYTSSRQEGNLVAANENIDALLETLSRYGSEAARETGKIVGAHRAEDQITQITKRTLEIARQFEDDINGSRQLASEELSAIRKARTRATDFNTKLLEGSESDTSIKSKIEAFLMQASTNAQEIKSFHTALIVGSSNEESTQAQVKSAAAKIIEAQLQANEKLNAISYQTEELDNFHKKIFGDDDSEVGLKKELENRLNDLNSYENSQKLRYKTLSDQVEDLLPGAASAGLASSFRAMRDEFKDPIANYTRVFYGSIGLMLFVALCSSVEHMSISPFSLTFAKSTDLTDTLRRLLERAPVVLPLVWLAVFSATRRSQYERLQQEYAHKQALASSYESYKSQINALGDDADSLLKELISRAIETVSFNASTTLDGGHEQKLPLEILIDKLSPSQIDRLYQLILAKKTS